MEQSINVVSDLKNLSELLGGSTVDQARLVPSGGRLRLELDLTRACRELVTTERRGFLKRPKTPWMKSRLTLEPIAEAMVQRVTESSPSPEPLIACEAVPGGYQLVVTSPDGLRLSMRLEQLSGRFVDLGEPFHG
jgi:hypothetical protein